MNKRYLTLVTQLASFSVILHLMNNGYTYVSISLMVALSLLSVIFGRVFCGYICPIRTIERISMEIRRILKIRQIQRLPDLPKWLTYALSFVLLVLLLLQAAAPFIPLKVRIPVLFIGFFIVFVVPGPFWHNNVCPFALLMKLPSKMRLGLPLIDNIKCKKCYKCIAVCPTDAITTKDSLLFINEKRCILCYRCERECKFGAIKE